MPDTIREYSIGQFRGNFPDVPIATGVNMDELRELDADPMFVTLPVIPEVGATSRNGLLYDEALAISITKQINDNKPGGIFGHLKDEDRDSAFPIPDGQWVGASRDGKTVWGKAYIPPGAARDHIRRLKAVGGSIATSIYGKGAYEAVSDGVRRLKDFTLESVDFAPPERAALGYAASPHVTRELETSEEQNEMGETIVAEITAKDVPAPVKEQIIADWQKGSETQERISELETQIADRDTVIETLQTRLAEMQAQEFDSALNGKVAELVNWQAKSDEAKGKVEAFQRMVKEQILTRVGDERTADKVAEVADEVWSDLKPLAETVRDALAGPAAVVPSRVRSNGAIEDTHEARLQARARMGL